MSSILAVIIVRKVFIGLFFFYCLLLNHSFPTKPNSITNCFQLILFLLQTITNLHLLNAFRLFFDILKTGEKKRSKITMEKKIQLWYQWNYNTLQFMCYCVHLDQQSVDQRRCHVVNDTVGRNWKKRWFNYLSKFNGFTTNQKIKSKYLKRKESECNRVYGKAL